MVDVNGPSGFDATADRQHVGHAGVAGKPLHLFLEIDARGDTAGRKVRNGLITEITQMLCGIDQLHLRGGSGICQINAHALRKKTGKTCRAKHLRG